MRKTTKARILEHLRGRGGFVSGSELEACAEAWETKSSVISRRARELVNDGLVERGVSARRTVQYKALPLMTGKQLQPAMEFKTPEEANAFLRSLA